MEIITLNVPPTFDVEDRELKMILASQLYQKGKLSLGQAAKLVGYSKETFTELLSDYGVSLINHDPEDIEEDMIKCPKIFSLIEAVWLYLVKLADSSFFTNCSIASRQPPF